MDPDLRATVRRDGIVRAVRWAPHLEICGPSATLLDSRERAGVTIADLELVRDAPGAVAPVPEDDPEVDELARQLGIELDERPAAVTEVIVRFLCGGDDLARDAIVSWAALVGMLRVWFPDEVRDIEPLPRGKVEVRCSGCRGRLVDGVPGFWDWVRSNGHFPAACPLCGSDLPQWQPVKPRGTPRSAPLQLVGRGRSEAADLRMSDRRRGGRP